MGAVQRCIMAHFFFSLQLENVMSSPANKITPHLCLNSKRLIQLTKIHHLIPRAIGTGKRCCRIGRQRKVPLDLLQHLRLPVCMMLPMIGCARPPAELIDVHYSGQRWTLRPRLHAKFADKASAREKRVVPRIDAIIVVVHIAPDASEWILGNGVVGATRHRAVTLRRD